MYMMTQKGDSYIKTFSPLSGVRFLSWTLSRLNILYTSPVKPYYTKITFNNSHVTATYLYFNLPDIIEARSDQCIKTFSTLLGVRVVV